MPSLDDHFRALTKVTPPAWPDLEALEPRPLRSRNLRKPRRLRTRPIPRQGHRVSAAALALTVAAAGTGFAIWAFGGATQPRPAAVVGNGKIAFVGETETDLYVNGTQSGIFVANSDGSGRAALIDDPTTFEWDPAWSPDGSTIAFALGGEAAESSAGLYVANSDGSGVTLVLEDGTGPTSPSWSPDGGEIVFETGLGQEQTGSGDRDVYSIDVESGELTRLTHDPARDEYPALSPDGSRIAFTRQQDGVVDIYLMNADGTGMTQLTSGEGTDFRPAWSPDGTRIAFERDADIYAMNADGSNLMRLTQGPAEDREPTWSPDGIRIAFQRDEDLYVMNVAGTAVTRLTETPQVESSPTWQPVPVEQESPEPSVSPSSTAVTAQVAGRVRLEGIPGPVAAADGAVWVATYDYEEEQAAVVRIDAATNEVVASVPVDGVVYNLAVGAGAVWVPVGAQPSVALVRIDVTTNEVTGRVEGVHGPVVVDPAGVWAIEDGPDERDAAVVQIDPETLQVEARVPVGETPFDMVAGAGSIWVAARDPTSRHNEPGDLLRIDASSGTLAATIPIESAGTWIAADDTGVWVNDWDPEDPHDAKAYFIDASTNAVSGAPGDVYNFRPFAVTGDRVWFISGPHDRGLPDGGVCGLNVVTRTVDVCAEPESAPDLTLAHDPAAFDPVTNSVWLGTFDKPWVTRIDVVSAS